MGRRCKRFQYRHLVVEAWTILGCRRKLDSIDDCWTISTAEDGDGKVQQFANVSIWKEMVERRCYVGTQGTARRSLAEKVFQCRLVICVQQVVGSNFFHTISVYRASW